MSAVFFVVILVGVGVGLSDCASVQNPESFISEESIESLASSRILMDHTSSLSLSLPPPSQILKATGVSQSSSLSSSKILKPAVGIASADSVTKTGSDDLKKEDVVSPLHVAQCRATCLQKFALQDNDKATSANQPKSKMNSEMPNLLRLKRKKRASLLSLSSSSSAAFCFQNSVECRSCWKSCQLLEVLTPTSPGTGNGTNPEAIFSPSPSSASTLPATTQLNNEEGSKGNSEEEKKSKHPVLACSKTNGDSGKPCMGGCQFACSFYERLLTKAGEGRDGSFMGADPVVATKHESVVKIVPGKITWPDAAAVSSSALSSSPVVYVVIQEYPDRKWRQIAQTTDQELSIPTELTGAMKTKLRSVRVLVVGPEGLRSIYSPLDSATPQQQQKQRQQRQFSFSAKKNDKFGKMGEEKETSGASTAEAITTETNDYDINNNSNVEMGARESDASTNEAPELETERESGTMPTAEISSYTTTASPSGGGPAAVVKPFAVRLVSLIHQKSLVIAELRWDDVGGNPSQEYLITWELTGGGLKGHLVTDSTSVTLSLWPDTTYQIQVEEFQLNLDSDGEQPTPENSDLGIKSFPLIVDTSIASFPMERPSALLSDKADEQDGEEDNDNEDYQQDNQDEFSEEENDEEIEEEDEQPLGHKSIGKVLLVSFISLVLVLGIFMLVAFTWLKLRMLSCEQSCAKVECGSENGGGCCEGTSCLSLCFGCGCDADSEKDPNLLVSQEDTYSASQDECANAYYASPLDYVSSLKKSQYGGNKMSCSSKQSSQPNKMAGQQNLPVAVISSFASSLPQSSAATAGEISGGESCSLFHCYYNNALSSSGNFTSLSLAPASEAAVAETKSSKQGCPSFLISLPDH